LVHKHAHRQALAFDADTFEFLCRRFVEANAKGVDRSVSNRLTTRPIPLSPGLEKKSQLSDVGSTRSSVAQGWRERGERALRAGQVAVVVLNGGMAMRFGGGAKGVERLVDESSHSFLSLRLAQIAQLGERLGAAIPVAVMHSFATEAASEAHLNDVDWAGVPEASRISFVQGVMPRISTSGEPLFRRSDAEHWPQTSLYAAPGHGDTWTSLQRSGVLAAWLNRGVQDILICNVDNIGATLDPTVLGAHLAATEAGAELSVEVVARKSDDAGGYVALVDGRPTIVEGFRMPLDVCVDDFDAFNTNTLWFRAAALARQSELHWFDVHRTLATPKGDSLPIVQFEQLIGQATDFLQTHVLRVGRSDRFVPIKTREHLSAAADEIRRRIAVVEG
jgi:UTP--glucose-1-phosphate uridylyltransferase